MSSKELYKRFVSICKKWPRDETKIGRDYGDNLRDLFKTHFPHGEQSQVKNPQTLEESISCLERIVNNSYFNENPLKRSSASGMEKWACRVAVSTEGLRAIQEQDEASLVRRLRQALNIKFVKEVDPNLLEDSGDGNKTSNLEKKTTSTEETTTTTKSTTKI